MALRTLVSNASRRAGARSFAGPAAVSSDNTEAVVNSIGNGLRVGTISRGGETATITAWVDAGSRYETPQTNGVAQLFGTSAMASKAKEISALGGMVSCNTSREFVVFEAKVLKENVAAATKLLGDMVTGSGDVESAKATMLAELNATRLNPEQVLMEHLHDAAYLDTAMGMSTMGTKETVSSLTKEDVASFVKDHVTASRTVVAASGAIDAAQFNKLVEDSFKNISTVVSPSSAMTKATFTGSDKRMRFDSKKVAHIAIAFQSNGYADNKSARDEIPLMLVESYLGEIDAVNDTSLLNKNATSWLKADQAPNGELPGANGPITLNIINQKYKDSGLFGISYSAYDNNIEESMYFNLYNLLRLLHHATVDDLNFAKTQLKQSLSMKLNDNQGLAQHLASSLSTQGGTAVSKQELFDFIDSCSIDEFKSCLDKVVNDKDHALAAAGPIHELPDYNWIRRRSYWLRY